MPPISEEDSQISFQNKEDGKMGFTDKEPLRPPVYNPEDYATSLKKWAKRGSTGAQMPLYMSQSTGSIERLSLELCLQNKRQSSPSTKSSSSIKSGDEKQTNKKDKESTLKVEKRDLKNKENISRGIKNDLSKDFLNPILALSMQEEEMSLRQFSSVAELLGKLKVDLKLAFPSFVQEFVGDPIDGVTLLLELLRVVQLSQTSQHQRCPPQILRRALLDEHFCLICLKHCLRCSDAPRRLASSPAGLFTLAVCIMSNVTQSRIIALELLIKACEASAGGHKAVSEALSTLRLRFGEPVRFRFLVGMLNSAGAIELLATAMKFINIFVETAPSLQQKIYIQAELEQAGFDSKILRRTLPSNSESVKTELNKWEKNYFDVEALQGRVTEMNMMHEKIQLLEKRVEILQEEKEILQSLEQCLKERCSELEEEISVKSVPAAKSSSSKPFRNYNAQPSKKSTEKGESTPAEDEGISSSEQELSQDEDYVKKVIHYSDSNDLEPTCLSKNMETIKNSANKPIKYQNKTPENNNTNCYSFKNMKNKITMKETNVDDGNEIIPTNCENDEEEETTIDKVIEELENIVNDAETEVCAAEEKVKFVSVNPSVTHLRNIAEITSEEKCRTYTARSKAQENSFEESEIVPANLHPQPPKKAKSLIHIYFPEREFDSSDRNKSEFFDEDSDSESSDSLLTATREKLPMRKSCQRPLEISDSFNSFSSVNTRTLFIKQEEEEHKNLKKLGYEERNIDEEELKRKHLKNPTYMPEQTHREFPEVILKSKNFIQESQKPEQGKAKDRVSGFGNFYEKTTLFQSIKTNNADKVLKESPFSRSERLVPTPVKRSQTFHITSSSDEKFQKRSDIKPKPKMGVSGLDFQRNTEQKTKNENRKIGFEYKKNSEWQSDTNSRYSNKVHPSPQSREIKESGVRENSFDGQFSPNVDRLKQCSIVKETSAKLKSKSLEKMDDGLDSLVDIVISTDETRKQKIKNEWNGEVSKNIGPRTRRSLAESSLFSPQFTKNLIKPEDSPKPPKPAQRTSLTRNNSSTTTLHLPIEIKLAHVQPEQQSQFVYNFGLKPAKSEGSLLASVSQRCPPDGANNPGENFENKSNNYLSQGNTPKIQKFFTNHKFENGTTGNDQVKSHFNAGKEKSVSPSPRNISKSGADQNKKGTTVGQKGEKDKAQAKPSFLIGTYQSQPLRNSSNPTNNTSVLRSISTFTNNAFLRSNTTNSNYSGTEKSNAGFSEGAKKSKTSENSRQFGMKVSGSEKVTDSPSGLY